MANIVTKLLPNNRYQVVTKGRNCRERLPLVAPPSRIRLAVWTGLTELALLWERREGEFLPFRAYKALGSGGRTGLQVAMALKVNGQCGTPWVEYCLFLWQLLFRGDT
jgi:hypothetical protein